jgi:methionyl-tRNA formyltransferase
MGTPALAIPALEATQQSSELLAAVTQPPRKKGRGLKEAPSAIAMRCQELGINILAPESVRTEAFLDTIRRMAPDVIVVVAYGKILPAELLAIPRLGCLNVHASLLPELRGAGPIQWAIARGFATTGVTLMQMDEGMDTGPILLQRPTDIGEDETSPGLGQRLAQMGAELLAEGLPALERGELKPRAQDEELATYAPLLNREDGAANWKMPASEIYNRFRGFNPWPGLYTSREGRNLHIIDARAEAGGANHPPGTVTDADRDGIRVACGEGSLLITRLKPEGSREMSAAEYLAGHNVKTGEKLG